jgi:hypothetical protein
LLGARRGTHPPPTLPTIPPKPPTPISSNANVIPYHKLEHHVRAHLDATSPRALAVLRPLRVVITNLPEGHAEAVQALHFPGRADSGYTVRGRGLGHWPAADAPRCGGRHPGDAGAPRALGACLPAPLSPPLPCPTPHLLNPRSP